MGSAIYLVGSTNCAIHGRGIGSGAAKTVITLVTIEMLANVTWTVRGTGTELEGVSWLVTILHVSKLQTALLVSAEELTRGLPAGITELVCQICLASWTTSAFVHACRDWIPGAQN